MTSVLIYDKTLATTRILQKYHGAPCSFNDCNGNRVLRRSNNYKKGTYRCNKCKRISNKFYDSKQAYNDLMRQVHLFDTTEKLLTEQAKQISTYCVTEKEFEKKNKVK